MPRRLRVVYEAQEDFQREFAKNIANGGIFVSTTESFELREAVLVELDLSHRGERLELMGEVVHTVPRELAGAGASPGVAVQFSMEAADLRMKLEPFAGISLPTGNVDEQREGSGRRKAPRTRARAIARLRVEGEWLSGRTRNISNTGMLVTLPGGSLPIGQQVGVSLVHPVTHAALELSGVVTRHLHSGGMACMGIEFQVPPQREERVTSFVNELRASEHARRLGGINGPIADLGAAGLLEMFAATAKTGMLTLTRGAEEGYIAFAEDGIQAQLGGVAGQAALDAMLEWRDGNFEWEALVDPGLFENAPVAVEEALADPPPPEPVEPLPQATRVPTSVDDAIELPEADTPPDEEPEPDDFLELELVDEVPYTDDDEDEELPGADDAWELPEEELDTQAPSQTDASLRPEAILWADAEVADALRPEFSKTEEALVDLAMAGMTVAKALEIIPEPDEAIREALLELVDRGVVALRG